MLCTFVEPRRNRLIFSGAAAPEPIFGKMDTRELRLEDGNGMLLGVRDGSVCEDRELAFPKGSFMFLFSDVLFESPTVDGSDTLEIDGVVYLAKDALTNASVAPLEHILKRFDAEVEQPLNDDLRPYGSLVISNHYCGNNISAMICVSSANVRNTKPSAPPPTTAAKSHTQCQPTTNTPSNTKTGSEMPTMTASFAPC